MRFAMLLALVGLTACTGDAVSIEGDSEGTVIAATQSNPGIASAPGIQGPGGRPSTGSGTPNHVAMWITEARLGDAPIKVTNDGDLIVRPGTAIILVSEDGTKCWRLSGEGFQKLSPNCPAY